MARVIDVSNSGGELVVIGNSIVLPNGNSKTASKGAIRFDNTTNNVEFFDGDKWVQLISNTLAVSLLGASNGIATLDDTGKLHSNQLSAVVAGGLVFEGTWNAETNIPTIISATGNKGSFYTVSVSGKTVIDEIVDWQTGDLLIFDGNKWDKITAASSNLTAAGMATIDSPNFTGNPTVPTPSSNVQAETIANVGFVLAQPNKPITLSGAISGSGTGSIFTNLAPLDSNTIMANIKPDADSPVGISLTCLLDAIIGDQTGAILYRSNEGWSALPPGNPQTVLQGNPIEWIDPVKSFNSRTGEITLTRVDITSALGCDVIKSINNQSPVDGDINFNLVSSFNGRPGSVELNAGDIIDALGYTPLQSVKGLSVSFGGSVLSSPYYANQILYRVAIGFPVCLPKEMADSTAVCLTPPINTVSLGIFKNKDRIGSVLFDAGSTIGRCNLDGDVWFVVGDILEVDAANPADSAFGNITFTLVGYR